MKSYQDTQNLLHTYLSTIYKKLNKSSIRIAFLVQIKHISIYFCKNIIYFFWFKNKDIIQREEVENKTWLLISSKNNKDALEFAKKELIDTIWITSNTNKYASDLGEMNRLSFHKSIFYFFSIFNNIKTIHNSYNHYTFSIIDKIVEGTGKINACKKILKKGKPKCIIFTNDHSISNRSLLIAANKLNIPTIYIQHASVSEFFPPLQFNLNLLEGHDSYNKYKKCGPISGEVQLIGMPKFDNYYQLRKVKKCIQTIGICSNSLDKIRDIEKTIAFLSKNTDLIIHYRPHPRDNRMVSLPPNIAKSNSKNEKIFDFLLKIDLLIAGNTSTHLEAILLNIPSIYFKFSKDSLFDDYYSYVKNMLIEKASDLNELISLIEKYNSKPQDVWKKAKYYNATVGTEYEGKSQELALKYIQEFLASTKGEAS